MLIFVGFETAANLAEEAENPKKAIPRAVMVSIVIVSVFYVIAAYAQIAGFGFDMASFLRSRGRRGPAVRPGFPGRRRLRTART